MSVHLVNNGSDRMLLDVFGHDLLWHFTLTPILLTRNEGHRCRLAEQLREIRFRIPENGISEGLHFDVLVVESGLRSAYMVLSESPK